MKPEKLLKIARNIARRYARAVWDVAIDVDDIASQALLYYYEQRQKRDVLPCHPDAWAVNYIKFGVLNCVRDRAVKKRVASFVDVDELAEVLPDPFDIGHKVDSDRVLNNPVYRHWLLCAAGYTVSEAVAMTGDSMYSIRQERATCPACDKKPAY